MRITKRDLLTFELIQRHGPLSSRYLFQLTKSEGQDWTGYQKRLLALTKDGYLDRPPKVNNPHIHDDFFVYVLTEDSRRALASIGKLYQFARPVGGGYEHQMMTAAATASVELECRDIRFLDQEAIIQASPAETQRARNPLAIPSTISRTTKVRGSATTQKSDRPTVPDQIFGIEYWPGKRRYFLIEADRGTESQRRADLDENSIERKILCYRDILKRRTFFKHFGVEKMFLLFLTVSAGRVENMKALVRELAPEYAHLFLFKAVPGFELYQRTPPLLPELWNEPWDRADHEPFAINEP